MKTDVNIFMFLSTEFEAMCAFSASSEGTSLPAKFAPWLGFGVVRPDQRPPHELSRAAIESGIDKNGYQLGAENRLRRLRQMQAQPSRRASLLDRSLLEEGSPD